MASTGNERFSHEDVAQLVEMNRRLVETLARAHELEEERHAYFAHVLANVTDAVVATDMRLMVTAWNPGAERLYGWQADEAIGQRQEDVTGVDAPPPGALSPLGAGAPSQGRTTAPRGGRHHPPL